MIKFYGFHLLQKVRPATLQYFFIEMKREVYKIKRHLMQ